MCIRDSLWGTQWNGTEDLSAKFYSVWNETGMRFRVDIRDNQFSFPVNAVSAWQYDSLQFFFDMNRDATEEADAKKKNMSDDVDYNIAWVEGKTPQAYLARADGDRFIGEANAVTGLDSAVGISCKKLSEFIIRYEVFFPREALYAINFQPGSTLGFSMLTNDNDGKGRKTGLTLAPKGKEPFMKPHLYKDMILVKQPQRQKQKQRKNANVEYPCRKRFDSSRMRYLCHRRRLHRCLCRHTGSQAWCEGRYRGKTEPLWRSCDQWQSEYLALSI
eukprot:TRINITY_DN14873_c0_g1_i3.p1 TRINITY_DN14873_c0_g1~~TRINITY_DN14873_c0_g1_i3.p1  ORF type:complete len:274 (+),score=-7.68 TRINITY_DN14873_c0_g1_i3:93-914(+)